MNASPFYQGGKFFSGWGDMKKLYQWLFQPNYTFLDLCINAASVYIAYDGYYVIGFALALIGHPFISYLRGKLLWK